MIEFLHTNAWVAPLAILVAIVLAIYSWRLTGKLRQMAYNNIALFEQVEAANQRYAHAARAANMASWEWDLQTDSFAFSDEAADVFGLEPGTTLNHPEFIERIHPKDRDAYRKALAEARAGDGWFHCRLRFEDADGRIRVVHDSGEVIRDEFFKPVMLRGIVCDVTATAEADSEKREADKNLSRILNNMQDTYFFADTNNRITSLSPSVESLLGQKAEAFIGKKLPELFGVVGYGRAFLEDLRLHGGEMSGYEILMRRLDGDKIWVSINASVIRGKNGQTRGIEGTIRDIDKLKSAHEALHQEKEQALVTLHSIGDGVITTNKEGFLQFVNPTVERLTGLSSGDMVGKHYQQVLKLVDEQSGKPLDDLVRLCLSRESGVVHADDGILTREDGVQYHLKVSVTTMRDHRGQEVGAVMVLHDLTELMGMARQLTYQANHDVLTGLFNRRVFEQRAEQAVREAQTASGKHVLFYLDLDQFKVVNDTCGHKAGDELLEQIANQIQKQLREQGVLARLGGDEFGILLENCDLDKAKKIAENIRIAIRDYRFAWEGKTFEIGVSIGVVPIDEGCGTAADVLASADAACYVAKDNGRNRIHVYQAGDEAVTQRHGEMEWVHRVSAAMDEDRLELYAQPIVHVDAERVISHYEVLVRMVDEQGRRVPPGAFIPAAERYNLMSSIDRWVIKRTLQMMKQAQGNLAFPPIDCAINLSGQSLCDESILDYVVELFEAYEIPYESVCFEVTETAAIANLSKGTRVIRQLRELGCSFALDDFGAGLSSFGYLKSLPVDYLKIDGSFVKDMVFDRLDRAMVESINQIGHVMGLKTIAEFAEDEGVLLALERAGVDYAQGNGIAEPRPFSEILDMHVRHPGETPTVIGVGKLENGLA